MPGLGHPVKRRIEQMIQTAKPRLLEAINKHRFEWKSIYYGYMGGVADSAGIGDDLDPDSSDYETLLEATVRDHPQTKDAYESLQLQIWRVVREVVEIEWDDMLYSHVLVPLGQPAVVTLRELKELAVVHLFSDVTVDPDAAIGGFQAAIYGRVGRFRRSKRLFVGTADPSFNVDAIGSVVWSDDRMEIRLEVRPAVTIRQFRTFELPKQHNYVRLYTRMHVWASPPASQRLAVRARAVVRAALYAAADLLDPGEVVADQFFPRMSTGALSNGQQLMTDLIQAFFTPSYEPDRFKARLQIAAQLIVGAGRRHNDAVAISLYFAAIEALVGDEDRSQSRVRRERLVALVEPAPQLRDWALKRVKDLYDKRNCAIHGSSLDSQAQEHACARSLATHAFKAVLEHHRFVERSEGVCPEDRLRNDLDAAFVSRTPVAGVTPSKVRLCWE